MSILFVYAQQIRNVALCQSMHNLETLTWSLCEISLSNGQLKNTYSRTVYVLRSQFTKCFVNSNCKYSVLHTSLAQFIFQRVIDKLQVWWASYYLRFFLCHSSVCTHSASRGCYQYSEFQRTVYSLHIKVANVTIWA